MSTLRPLGEGSQVLIHGDRMAGFYGEVNGIITADELRNVSGVSQGTSMQTGDITWLKFSHNYKTLFIAKQPIQHSISWDYLQERDLVFGKMVEIGGSVYLLRLMQGSSVNPRIAGDGDGSNNEYSTLIRRSVLNWNLYSVGDLIPSVVGERTWCQEIYTTTSSRMGLGSASSITTGEGPVSYNTDTNKGWRPVLELLY